MVQDELAKHFDKGLLLTMYATESELATN